MNPDVFAPNDIGSVKMWLDRMSKDPKPQMTIKINVMFDEIGSGYTLTRSSNSKPRSVELALEGLLKILEAEK